MSRRLGGDQGTTTETIGRGRAPILVVVLLAVTVSGSRAETKVGAIGSTCNACNPRVANLRDVGVSVVWGTSTPQIGYLLVGDAEDNLTEEVCDTRDTSTDCSGAFGTHFVDITALPSTTLWVQIISGGSPLSAPFPVTTCPTLPSIPPSDTIFGQLTRPDTTFAADAYTCVTIRDADGSGSPGDSTTLCDLINPGESGFWAVNLGNARTQALTSSFSYSPSGGDDLIQEACGGHDEVATQTVDTADDAPSPTMQLAPSVDTDGDGVPDACDNCVLVRNLSQSDTDDDFEGDYCDTDDGLIYLLTDDPNYVQWDAEQGYLSWNLYRGDLTTLASTGIYTQVPGSNSLASQECGLGDVFVEDLAEPGPEQVAFYLATGLNGAESGLGQDGEGSTRENDNPCR